MPVLPFLATPPRPPFQALALDQTIAQLRQRRRISGAILAVITGVNFATFALAPELRLGHFLFPAYVLVAGWMLGGMTTMIHYLERLRAALVVTRVVALAGPQPKDAPTVEVDVCLN